MSCSRRLVGIPAAFSCTNTFAATGTSSAQNRNEDNEAEWELLRVLIFVAVLMLLAWYFNMFG
jgi:ABC-type multidrug transport system permease subunit